MAAAATSVQTPTRVDVRPLPDSLRLEESALASPSAVPDHALHLTADTPADWGSRVAAQSRLMYHYLRDRTSPTRLRQAWRPKHTHIAVQAAYTAATILLFLLLYYFNGFAARVSGYGVPQDITCHYVGWGGCGINGGDCQPFDQPQWSALRCPHRCTLLKTDNTVIGGKDGIYKADSHICNSALHAGVIDDSTGGCFLYRPSGVQGSFYSGGTRAGLTSLSFPSWFPGSMTFASVDSSYCSNYGVAILVVGIFWLAALALIRPNALLLWLLMLFWGFWYCTLTLTDSATQRQLFWNANANCLVLAVGGYVLFHLSPKYTLYVTPEYAATSPNQWPWKICTQRQRLFWKGQRVHSHQTARAAAPVVTVGLASVSSSGERPSDSVNPSRLDSRSLHAPLVVGSDPSMSPSPSPSPTAGPSESPPATSIYYSPPRPRDMEEADLASPSNVATLAALPPPLLVDRSGTATAAAAAAASKPVPSVSNGGLVLRPWYDLYFLYILPMLAAFHFTYLIYVPQFKDIDLDSKFFSHGAGGTILIICFILVVGATVIYHMAMAWRINILFQYLLYYAYVLMGVIFVSALFFAGASFHLHHYLAGMLLVPLSRFPSRVSLVFQAIAAGIMVNGLAVWGLDAAWDVTTTAVPSFNRARNPPPQVFPIANATTDSLFIAWEVEGPYTDAIGSSLMLNGVEIYHSTFVDTTYGGGFTPVNSSAAVMAATPASAGFDLTTPGSQISGQGMAILSVRPRGKRRVESMRHNPSAASSLLAMLSRANSLHMELSSMHAPPQIALPSYSLARVDRRSSRTADRSASAVQPRFAPEFPLITSDHVRALSTTLSASSASRLQQLQQMYYIFQLINLRPNTSYLLSAGYIEPGGLDNYGRTIIIRTAQARG